jgi:hypothetical protein
MILKTAVGLAGNLRRDGSPDPLEVGRSAEHDGREVHGLWERKMSAGVVVVHDLLAAPPVRDPCTTELGQARLTATAKHARGWPEGLRRDDV